MLLHKDTALQVYGTDRLPETPISGSNAENQFEKGFRKALLAFSAREAEPSKPSPIAAPGAKARVHPTSHKGATSEGGLIQGAKPSQGSSLATNAVKAKHKSRTSGQEARRKARDDPLSLHKVPPLAAAVGSEGPPDHSTDWKHSRKCIS